MRTRMLIVFFGLAVSGFALAESPGDSAECVVLDTRARDIESRIMDYDAVEGQFGAGAWRAYLDDGDLVYLVEHQDFGERSEADVWYWFDDRGLFRYQGRAHLRMAESDRPAEFQDIRRTMWFGPGGKLIEAEQTCDGAGVVPVDEEAHAAYRRALGLQAEVIRAIEGRRAGERFFCAGEDPAWNATLMATRLRYEEGNRKQVLVGRGEYKDDDKSLYEWQGKAAGYGADATARMRRDECKLGNERWRWKATIQFPEQVEVDGCCDVRPAESLLATVDAPKQVEYRCEEGELSVWFLRGGEMAVVKLEDATYTLPRVAADSGDRFSDIGITLHTEGKQSSLERGDQTVFSACKAGS